MSRKSWTTGSAQWSTLCETLQFVLVYCHKPTSLPLGLMQFYIFFKLRAPWVKFSFFLLILSLCLKMCHTGLFFFIFVFFSSAFNTVDRVDGRLDSRVVFTLNFEYRYATPWAVNSSLGDVKLFFGPKHNIYALFVILFDLFDLILLFVCRICHVDCEAENWK